MARFVFEPRTRTDPQSIGLIFGNPDNDGRVLIPNRIVDGGVWRPYAYCRTRVGLETALSRLRCEGIYLDPSLIAHLPDYFPEAEYRRTDAANEDEPNQAVERQIAAIECER
jgi:hypothetical protein